MKDIGLRIQDAEAPVDRRQPHAINEATTLGDVMAALRRQYLPLILCAVMGMVVGAAHHLTTPKQYYTSSTVLVNERGSEVDQEITASIPFARNDTSLLNEMQVLKSLQLATEVASTLNLQNNDVFMYPPSSLARDIVSGLQQRVTGVIGLGEAPDEPATVDLEQQRINQLTAAASRLQRDILVTRIGLSFSIEISYVGHDPELAADIVNTYAAAYLEDGLNANVESTERTAAWMRERLDTLEANAADVLAQAAALRQSDPTKVAELRDLAQRAATLDALHQTISARYEQILIQGSFPISNGRILTQSTVPQKAALPKLWQTLALTTLLGLMFGFAIAVLREAGDRAFRVSTDVHNDTGLAFLGHLPRVFAKNIADAPIPKTKRMTFSGGDQSAATNDVAKMETYRRKAKDTAPLYFWSVLMPQSMFSETLRNIHATVDLGTSDHPSKVVAVTSMLPDEGKTMLAVNYANMLAKSGARTLLIDMDLQNTSISDALKIPSVPGMTEVVGGTAALPDALHKLDFTGLNILPSGPAQQQSVTGDVAYQQDLISELRKHYDYIVLDLPPLGRGSGAKSMIGQLDQIVLVCEWGKTHRSLVAQYLAHEPEIAQKVAGIALNKVNVRQLRKYARPGWPESYLATDM
ncbi:AAA family ATPase [Roseobacter sp. CCS2]|uniref:AAA family ATPase n=1 Tax=Roseobacter sp. CCS2 TaxID=391593 RepID=UPI0000F3C755|nr:AAA family ATPase [Roseobacter sp. CCS2]EBA11552.1 exopolysaccharide transport protein family [Roseobacter sp. CCS2]